MNTWTLKILTAFMFPCLAMLTSCETEPDPANKVNNENNGDCTNPAENFTSDELSGFLVLENADMTAGALPEAPDFHLTLNVKDTIYVMKGSYGARVVVRHNGLHDVDGFYIAVAGSSSYYDVPAVEDERQDSTDVFYIDIDARGHDLGCCPLTIPITIQPHDPNGAPLDEFDRHVTMEDPEQCVGCPITIPSAGDNVDLTYGVWKWVHTLGIDNAGNIFYRGAPGLKIGSTSNTGGCCGEDGTSSTVADDPYCFAKYSDGTSNPRWRSIEASTYVVTPYLIWQLYENGRFAQRDESQTGIYRPSMSDFCNGIPFYEILDALHVKGGTHDFTPGTKHLDLTYDVTDPPVFGKTIADGELSYTCNSMRLTNNVEGQTFITVFTKASPGEFTGSNGSVVAVRDWD